MNRLIIIIVWMTFILFSSPQKCFGQFELLPESYQFRVDEIASFNIFSMSMNQVKNELSCKVKDTGIAHIVSVDQDGFTVIALAQGKTSISVLFDGSSTSIEIIVNERIELIIDSLKQALLYAVMEENPSNVNKLLREGMDPNIKNEQDWTPLHIAAYKGNIEIGKLLILQGVDYLTENGDGKTPFVLAQAYGKNDFRENVAGLLCKKKNEKLYLGKFNQGDVIQQLFHICKDGNQSESTDKFDENTDEIPGDFVLHEIQPDPVISEAEIHFEVPKTSRVSLKIFDLDANVIRTLTDEDYSPGHYSLIWDGNDNEGKEVPIGIYMCYMNAEDFRSIKKMSLIR